MVKRRHSGWQADFRWEGKRVRKSFETEPEALAWEAEAKKQLARGVPLDTLLNPPDGDGTWTLKSLLDAVTDRHWSGTANEDNAVRNAQAVVDILGSMKNPRDVTTTDLDVVTAALVKKGNSPATINRKLAAFGKMMTHAASRGIIDRRPLIERKREKEGRLRWYTPQEEAALLKAIKDPDFRDLVTFLVDTGCRLGEALKIEWRDTDDVYARFHGRKGGNSGAVPLTQRVRALLKSRRRADAPPTALVFPGWDRFKANKAWTEAKAGAGITDDEAVLHALRHTCASRLVQAGVPIQVVQQWLGHKTLTMTLRYAHLAPVNMLQAVKVLETVTTSPDSVRGEKVTDESATAVTSVTSGKVRQSAESALVA